MSTNIRAASIAPMHGDIPTDASVEGDVVQVWVTDTVRTYPLSGSLLRPPTDRPSHHVVLARVVYPAVPTGTLIGAMNVGQNATLHGYQIPSGEVESFAVLACWGVRDPVSSSVVMAWRLAAAPDTDNERPVASPRSSLGQSNRPLPRPDNHKP